MNLQLENLYFFSFLLFIPIYIFFRIQILQNNSISYSPVQLNKYNLKNKHIYLLLPLETILIILFIIALLNPHQKKSIHLVEDKGIDISLVLDISASMQAADLKPNRLEALKKIVKKFISKNKTDRISIFVFAKEVFQQAPLTTDHLILSEAVDGIAYEMINHIYSGGTAIGDALIKASDSLAKQKIEKRDQVIILVTDGESRNGLDPIIAAKYIKEKNIKFYSIGIGKKEPVEVYVYGKPFINTLNEVLTTSLDDKQLKQLTKITNGKYYRAIDEHTLDKIFKELASLEKTPIKSRKVFTIISYRNIIALSMLIIFLIWFFINATFVKRPIR